MKVQQNGIVAKKFRQSSSSKNIGCLTRDCSKAFMTRSNINKLISRKNLVTLTQKLIGNNMKKRSVVYLIMICLLSLPILSVRPVRAQYQGGFSIGSDGTVSPSDAPVLQVGDIYTLTSDVNGSIAVFGNNLVLNGNGHTVISSFGSSGIMLHGTTNVTLENLVIEGGAFGIYVQGEENSIVNNTITEIARLIFLMAVTQPASLLTEATQTT